MYDKNFNLISILPKYISVNWEIKFKEYGLGEIELERTEENVRLFTENKRLFIFQNDIQAIVTGVKIGETITVFLRTLEWLLTKFVTEKFTAKELVSAEKVTLTALLEAMLSTFLHQSFNLSFSGFSSDESDVSDYLSDGIDTIYSQIGKLLTDNKYGFRFVKDIKNDRFIFSLLLAEEKDCVLLYDEYKTAYESEYNYDIQEEISGGVFCQRVVNMGSWDADYNEPTLTITPENYGKYYTVSVTGTYFNQYFKEGDIILCKDESGEFTKVDKAEDFYVRLEPEEDGIFSWCGALSEQNIVSAKEKIKNSKPLDMLTCKTVLSYPEDFKLGDIVKVKFSADSFSCTQRKLISEIHLWDEPDDTGTRPTTINVE